MTGSACSRKVGAEFLGSAFLLATVIGSGIMGERLAGGNEALALLGNTLPTGAILIVIITILAPVSGAHFNPAVTLALFVRKEIGTKLALAYVSAQIAGAATGVAAAHLMFDLPLMELSTKVRTGSGQFFSEVVATFGLLTIILLTRKAKTDFVPVAVGLYITAAYWFTASTSFANPAVTLARALSDTFAGIRPADVPLFVTAQIIGALAALPVCAWLIGTEKSRQEPSAQSVLSE
ncbi:MIP/aquaporin family protein [Hyphomicrobium sp. ghe19]|uniref:aquaporin n=1 Tax=Hyphomicrobium sp. ghe19 TaxID=2682968 RepID=UPI001367766D|nr:Propanediol diffusion facilitator [Hyphomicrobium sp. ghe19]